MTADRRAGAEAPICLGLPPKTGRRLRAAARALGLSEEEAARRAVGLGVSGLERAARNPRRGRGVGEQRRPAAKRG